RSPLAPSPPSRSSASDAGPDGCAGTGEAIRTPDAAHASRPDRLDSDRGREAARRRLRRSPPTRPVAEGEAAPGRRAPTPRRGPRPRVRPRRRLPDGPPRTRTLLRPRDLPPLGEGVEERRRLRRGE